MLINKIDHWTVVEKRTLSRSCADVLRDRRAPSDFLRRIGTTSRTDIAATNTCVQLARVCSEPRASQVRERGGGGGAVR